MYCSYYLSEGDQLEVAVTSEKLSSGTEEVGIRFIEIIGGNQSSHFTIKFRGKAFDRAIELAQDLSDKVIEAFKKSRREDLGTNSGKGGDVQKKNIKGLSVLNSQNMDRVR